MAVSLAREIAYDSFAAVMSQRKKPEQITEEFYEKFGKKLKRIDRAFIKEILYGSLRWHSKLYWILQNTSSRDLGKSSPEVIAALVVGTYQIYYMDKVPDRSAVNESVEYIKKKGQTSASGFVNGILRQIARKAQYFPKPDKEKEPIEYLALQYAHPKWIVERWSRHFKFDRMASMLSENNKPPPITVRCNRFKVEQTHEFQKELLRVENVHSDRCMIDCGLRLKQFPKTGPESFFSEGYFTFQDEASQLIGFLVNPSEEHRVLDTCAGPGGKLSHVFELSGGRAQIVAIERDERQMRRARETVERLGHLNGDGTAIEWLEQDFFSFESTELFDRVLVDAPCSGLGVLRRHPEGKWHKDPSVLPQLAETQRKMIDKALKHLKVGGELVYSVCSFEAEESVAQLSYVKEAYGSKVEVVSPASRLPDMYAKFVTKDHLLSVYSGNKEGMDGFSAFVLRLVEMV